MLKSKPMNFRQAADAFRKFLDDVPKVSAGPNNKTVGIALMPWMQTCVPWYAVALAILYRERGFQPHLIFHDTPFVDADQRELSWIVGLTQKINEHFPVVPLSGAEPQTLHPEQEDAVERLFEINTLSYLRRGMTFDFSAAGLKRALERFKYSAKCLKRTLEGHSYDHLVVPGGIYGQSGIYFALRPGCRVATFDSGLSSVVVGTNGIAAHCDDVRRCAISKDDRLLERRAAIVDAARREFYFRIRGKDRYRFQHVTPQKARVGAKCDILIPLNLFDDAAGIGRVRNFEDPENWLSAVLDHLAPLGLSVFVREHPDAARYPTDRSLFQRVATAHCDVPTFRFIRAEDKCNTYSLLSGARLVLPVSSSVGIEAACLGVPVVMESEAYFAQAPFVDFASTKGGFLKLITDYSKNPRRLSKEQSEEAWVWYYLSQVANSLKTRFTPVPEDFRVWVAAGYHKLRRGSDVQLIMDSLVSGEPMSKLVFEKEFSKGSRLFKGWPLTTDWESRIARALELPEHVAALP